MSIFADILTGQNILAASGLVLIVILFATGGILTLRQHNREMTAQKSAYEGRLADKDARYSDAKEALEIETKRADKYEAIVLRVVDIAEANTHVLAELDRAAKGSP